VNPIRPLRFLPTGRDQRPLVPWVIAVMMFLCGLGLAVGLALNGALAGWSGRLERAVTVQVALADPAEQNRQATAALALLQRTAGVAAARRLNDEAMARLLEPWLGKGNVVDALPVPAVIEVDLVPGRTVDLRALQARLIQVAPDAVLDDHGRWLAQVLTLSQLIQSLAWLIVALLLLATAAIVVFGARAGLASHAKSVEIMHLMGAEDHVIAGEFQWRYGLYGLQGGLIGAGLAGLAVWVMNRMARSLGEGLLPGLALDSATLALLILMPLFAAALTLATARLTVLSALKRMV